MMVYSRMATVFGVTATPTVLAQRQDLRLAIRASLVIVRPTIVDVVGEYMKYSLPVGREVRS